MKYCQNGAPCRIAIDQGKEMYMCNCEKAEGVGAFAGEECEYEATVYCNGGGEVQQEAFCVNGGKCKEGDDIIGADE